MKPWQHLVEQAPAGKPLGMLQGGSGAGALWALSAAPKEAHPSVLKAMMWDARWDRLLEKRALYFGRLAMELGLDLEPLFQHILANDSGRDIGEDFGRRTGILEISPIIELPLQIVAVLLAHGSEQARDFVRRYVSLGVFWQKFLEDAAETGGVATVAGFDEVLEARFTGQERLQGLGVCDSSREPWKSWLVSDSSALTWSLQEIARAFQPYRDRDRTRSEERNKRLKSASTEELLTIADGEYLEELVQRRSEEDVAVMLAAIRPENGKKAASAIRALGEHMDARMIEPTARTLEADPEESIICIQAAPFLRRFPAEIVLPLARRWQVSRSSSARHCARGILWDYATPDDIPLISPILRQAVTPNSIDSICDALRVVPRFKGHGPFQEVRRLFKEIPSSWGRSFAARALAATDPAFSTAYAYECLWDCESDTRAAGCEAVPLNDRRAREQLRSLASDPLEDEETRKAATERLSAPS